MADEAQNYEEIIAIIDLLIDQWQTHAPQFTLHEFVGHLPEERRPAGPVLHVLQGLAPHLEPEPEGPQPGKGPGGRTEVGPTAARGVKGLWEQLKRDGCTFGRGNVINVRVFPAGSPKIWMPPDSTEDQPRVYRVERNVAVCVEVKNYMIKDITVEAVFVNENDVAESKGIQVLKGLGQNYFTLNPILESHEERIRYRLQDNEGALITELHLLPIESS